MLLSLSQLEAVTKYIVEGGGSLLVLGAEGSVTSSSQLQASAASASSAGGGDGDDGGGGASPLNTLLKPFGMALNADVVLRTVYHKYLHPKEAFVAKGCVSPPFASAVAELQARRRAATAAALGGAGAAAVVDHTAAAGLGSGGGDSNAVEFVYPRGCTLEVARPATILLASGHASYPVQRPLAAVWEHRTSRGRVAVVGSADMFRDEWITKECNGAIADALFRWLCVGRRKRRREQQQHQRTTSSSAGTAGRPAPNEDSSDDGSEGGARDFIDAHLASILTSGGGGSGEGGEGGRGQPRQPAGPGGGASSSSSSSSLHPRLGDDDAPDQQFLPDTAALAERLRCCLQEPEPLPKDVHALFDMGLLRFHAGNVPEAVALYGALAVKHEPLTLIPPQFTPMPACTPAVFPPIQRELPPPGLELFDLDEQFANDRVRLAQLTNKCTDEDLDYYVRECGIVEGVMVGGGI